MAASILSRGETVIHNCPNLSDVNAAIKILTHLGCVCKREDERVIINSAEITRADIPHELMLEMRSSIIFLGAILARCGEATISTPGGCELGARPVDLHIFALRKMGAEIIEEGGNIVCRVKKFVGCRVNFLFPSVGATENAMLAATSCDGTTIITNAACEPEIWDLQNYLTALGFRVSGAGTPTVTVTGKSIKSDTEHFVIPDRIVAATFLSAAAITSGEIELLEVIPSHFSTVTDALGEMGCYIKVGERSVYIKADRQLRAIKPVMTQPYPGFPTDAQPPLLAASLTAEGTTVFIENIFDNRYRHVGELRRMGADIKIEGRVAMVSGVKKLHGAPVSSTDLRGGAALCVAALGAEGVTDVLGLAHIDRGYDNLSGILEKLGADIARVDKA